MSDLSILAYPFLFAAIYFEAFLLVTFLSAPAAAVRARKRSNETPSIAMIVPCYNEERTVGGTVESLLAVDYPKDRLSIILVDDGSTDATPAVMDSYAHVENVTVIHQENGGKHSALNAGIAISGGVDLIGCLDADSFVEASSIREMISAFDDADVGAATAAMSVHKPRTLLERMQNAEYVLGIALRHILAAVNGIYVTPGPLSLYRRDLIDRIGGFRKGHNTEDMEMALRIQRAGYRIESAHTARVYTKVPTSVPKLIKQRTRWTTGFLRNMTNEYRDLVGNPQFGALGVIVLPLGFLAIAGGIIMFFLVVYQLIRQGIETYLVTHGVPLNYTLSTFVPRLDSLEWYYAPVTMFSLIAIVAVAGTLLFVVVGKRISGTPEAINVTGMLGYVFVYGLIAPFWLIRSVADVAVGAYRNWR